MFAGLFLLGACGEDPRGNQPVIGARLPRVALTGLMGEVSTSTDALTGTPLIINVWATWCGPCRDEMPSLERLSRRLAGQGVRVVGVTVDTDLNLAAEFVRTYKLTFPNYADGDKAQFQSLLRVKALPETLLVTAEGVIAARVAGARDWNSAEGERLLESAFNLRIASGR